MQEPFEPPPPAARDATGVSEEDAPAGPDEIVAAPDPTLSRSLNSEGPLREIAHAFRLNAEALHTLKQMQGDLARSVRRGDRSELVLQSTQALNETFRNLTGVQRELLARLHQGQRGARGPLVPMMLLGLLVVLLGGIYVILDAVDARRPAAESVGTLDLHRLERDAWKEGRREGAQHADREIQRLQEALGEAKGRSQKLQNEIDTRAEQIAELERGRRMAEMERDEFGAQVRRAQSEIVAKKTLEEEVTALKLQLDAANKVAAQAELDLQLQRSRNAYLRERMADYGMGISEDDPPWRPGVPAGAEARTGEQPENLAPRRTPRTNRERLAEYLRARGAEPPSAADAQGDSAIPPPAAATGEPMSAPTRGARPPLVVPAPTTAPTPKRDATPRGGAARGGEVPPAGARAPARPPVAPVETEARSVDRVRTHLNKLLAGRSGGGGAGWRVTRIAGVSEDHLAGVVMQRYDRDGRMVESIEAQDVRIQLDRKARKVQFTFRRGLRYDHGRRAPLVPAGVPVVVSQGEDAVPWGGSQLRVIKTR